MTAEGVGGVEVGGLEHPSDDNKKTSILKYLGARHSEKPFIAFHPDKTGEADNTVYSYLTHERSRALRGNLLPQILQWRSGSCPGLQTPEPVQQ